MSNDLYFIPLLIKALESADIVEGLRRAIRAIIVLGQDERFRNGYGQFMVFMDAILAAQGHDVDQTETTITGGVDGMAALFGELAALPELDEIWDSIQKDLRLIPDADICVTFLLRRNDESPKWLQLSKEEPKGFFRGVLPGAYELSLSSGRVAWEAKLTKQDIFLAYAFAEEPLQLAADTEIVREKPTRRAVLLNGEVVISVFAGPESGRMEIEWCIA